MNRNFSEKLNYAFDHRFDKDNPQDILLHREIFDRTKQEKADLPKNVILAHALSAFLRRKSVRVDEGDILLGHSQHYDYVNTCPVERIPIHWMSPRGFRNHAPGAELPEALGGAAYEFRQFSRDNAVSTGSADFRDFSNLVIGTRNSLYAHNLISHTTPGYNRVLEYGFDALIAEAKQYDHAVAQASVLVLEGCSAYVSRYASAAAEAAAVAMDSENKQHLEKLAAAAAGIVHNRPRNYLEALQLVWFLHEIYAMECPPGAMSFGRLDLMLTPFYEMEDTDYQEALLLMCDFNAKVSLWKIWQQNLMIGGRTKDCDYLFSDVTKIIIEATRITRFDQPQISARWNANIPQACLDLYLDAIGEGGGYPSLFHEELLIQAKIDQGFAPEDAEDFCVVGCVETNIPGKEYSNTEGGRINYAKVLELMLNGGVFFHSADEFPGVYKDTYESFEEFYEDFRGNALCLTETMLRGLNVATAYVGKTWPYPFTSAIMYGCLESGRDAADGGTVYPYSTANAIALQDAANSLLVIKKLVFEEQFLTYDELKQALICNFEGYDELLQKIREVTKFGNDCDEVDSIFRCLAEDFLRFAAAYPNAFGRTYQPGLYSVEHHATMGKMTMALPNGRKAGISLSNGCAPMQGTDFCGPTAVINSVCKTDFSLAANGMVLDLKFVPQFFHKTAHREALKAFLQTYFRKGGLEIQFNVIDRETLIDAQRNPELHRDLVVRVSGYSAYFHTLNKETQDEIIQRTSYAAM